MTHRKRSGRDRGAADHVVVDHAAVDHAPVDRVAVVAGLRTPFTKQGTALRSLRTVDIATLVVKELMARSELAPKEVTLCVYGQVVPSLDWLNLAREVVLRAGLPRDIDAYSVSRACATSLQALTSATEAILAGQHDVAIVGGAGEGLDALLDRLG